MIKMRRAWLVPLGIACGALAAPAAVRADTSSFGYTGSEQTFTVPDGITTVHVVAIGGRGGGSGTGSGGYGARTAADIGVSPGQILYIEVGGNGGAAATNPSGACPGGMGGFNGGGAGGADTGSSGCPEPSGGGGAGASDVRTLSSSQPGSLDSRLVVAGGGGGAGNATAGGGAGQPGSGLWHGEPGTSSGGGAGGTYLGRSAGSGSQGQGGAGLPGNGGGGGGGGGLYGGGGGYNGSGSSYAASGGGGGSNGFGPGTSNTSVSADTTGSPSIMLTYAPGGAGNGGGPGGGGGGNGGGGSGGGSASSFALTHPSVSRNGVLTFVLTALAAGTFSGRATTLPPAVRHGKRRRPRPVKYGSGSATASHAGPVTLTIRPSGAAKSLLARSRRLTVVITMAFGPAAGGAPSTHQITITVASPKKAHR